jgi:zinc/manganese transport system substrate-binding protein
MKKIFNTIIGLFTLSLLFLTGCGSAPQSGSNALSVLASTSFLADIAQNVAGDRVEVKSLLPVGADAHAYQPAPSDVAKISESDVLILNGIEYEHFMESLIENAGGERVTIIASDGLEAREMEEHAEDEDHADEAEAGEGDVMRRVIRTCGWTRISSSPMWRISAMA